MPRKPARYTISLPDDLGERIDRMRASWDARHGARTPRSQAAAMLMRRALPALEAELGINLSDPDVRDYLRNGVER